MRERVMNMKGNQAVHWTWLEDFLLLIALEIGQNKGLSHLRTAYSLSLLLDKPDSMVYSRLQLLKNQIENEIQEFSS